MRPIERGSCPTDSAGKPKIFREYQEARGDLIARLGEYCSYCETRCRASLAVEHILPKSLHPKFEKDWNNFLLACPNCNSTKGSANIVSTNYYWPDRDNTFRAFDYLPDGSVRVSSKLSDSERQQALKTLQLTGLDKMPKDNPAMKDRRWLGRLEAWNIAERSLQNLKNHDTPFMRDQIVENAKSQGFWSVWMTVFRNDADMLCRLITAFDGTCRLCFDTDLNLVPRPGGAI